MNGSFEFEGKSISADPQQSVLDALLAAGEQVEHSCKAGSCQNCLLKTKDPLPTAAKAGLSDELLDQGGFLSCQAKSADVQQVERFSRQAFPQHSATLVRKQMLSPDVLLAEFHTPDLPLKRGAFVKLQDAAGIKRAYSIATPASVPNPCHPQEDLPPQATAPPPLSTQTLQLHVRLIPGGAMSESLQAAQEGDEFRVEGPFGRCCYNPAEPNAPLLMIGTGTGLAPLFAIASDALAHGHQGPIWLYHGAATGDRLYFRDRLSAMQTTHPGFRYVSCAESSPEPMDEVGSPLSVALQNHPDLSGFKVFLCGHPAMVKAGKRATFLAGANLRDILADAFEVSG